MAEAVSSAIVEQTVSQILSGLVQKFENEPGANRNLERLEMAHIRLVAAVETSYKWQISDASLLRWRKKLKCAAQECDDVLHKCKQRILEDEQIEQEVRNTSLPNRIAHATKSFVFSVFCDKNNDLSSSVVKRFEWFAASASEFLRFIELGGTPRRHIPFHSLIKNLFEGKELHHHVVQGNGHSLFQLWLLPCRSKEHGIDAILILIQKDDNRPEITIYFSIVVQISESTDIVGIAIKCLHLFAPHFRCAIENIMKELIQLHTQNTSWVPSVYSCQKEYSDLHNLGSQWFRPNPLCCKQQHQFELRRPSNSGIVGLSDASLESVNQVTFQTFLPEHIVSLQHVPSLKSGILFVPHRSLKSILPAHKGSEVVVVVGEGKSSFHTDITLDQLKETMLPKAIDYFCQNANARVYQMIWHSEHGYALIHFEKESMNTRRMNTGTQRTLRGSRKRKLLQGKDQEFGSRTRVNPNFLDLWAAHKPIKLQSLFMDWMQKEKEGQLEAQRSRTPEIPYSVWVIKEDREE